MLLYVVYTLFYIPKRARYCTLLPYNLYNFVVADAGRRVYANMPAAFNVLNLLRESSIDYSTVYSFTIR